MSGVLKASSILDGASATTNLALDSSGNVTVGNNLTVSGTGVLNIGSGQVYKDASGNVGIGTTAPGTKFAVGTSTDQAQLNGGITTNLGNATSVLYLGTPNNSSGGQFTIAYCRATGLTAMGLSTPGGNVGTAVNIDNSGNLLVGTTSTYNSATHSFANSGVSVFTLRNTTSTAGRYWFTGPDSSSSYIVYNNNLTGVYLGYGNTSWTANSDERLKTDLVPITDAANKVNTLRAVTGRYKTDEVGKSRSFLIAQDVQKVLPEAVDASDPEKLGVQYTEVIPLLVAALQEAVAKIDALETRIAQLESK